MPPLSLPRQYGCEMTATGTTSIRDQQPIKRVKTLHSDVPARLITCPQETDHFTGILIFGDETRFSHIALLLHNHSNLAFCTQSPNHPSSTVNTKPTVTQKIKFAFGFLSPPLYKRSLPTSKTKFPVSRNSPHREPSYLLTHHTTYITNPSGPKKAAWSHTARHSPCGCTLPTGF